MRDRIFSIIILITVVLFSVTTLSYALRSSGGSYRGTYGGRNRTAAWITVSL